MEQQNGVKLLLLNYFSGLFPGADPSSLCSPYLEAPRYLLGCWGFFVLHFPTQNTYRIVGFQVAILAPIYLAMNIWSVDEFVLWLKASEVMAWQCCNGNVWHKKPYDTVILHIPCLRTKDEFSVASPTDIWSKICSVNVKFCQCNL